MIWITGSKGMLGRHLTELLVDAGENPLLSDIDVDICSKASLEKFYYNNCKTKKISHIINCAAYTAVDAAEDNKEKAWEINQLGPEQLAKFCHAKGIILIHISTDYVFSGTRDVSYLESDATGPSSEYGRSKLAGEKSIIENLDKYFIIRTAWLYGPYGNNFVKTMLKLFSQKEKLKIVSDQYGAPTYTGDLAKLIIEIIKTNTEYGIYHFSNTGKTNWFEFAETILGMAKHYFKNQSFEVELSAINSSEFPQKAKRPSFSYFNTKKVEKIFPKLIRPWQKALEELFMDYKKNIEDELF